LKCDSVSSQIHFTPNSTALSDFGGIKKRTGNSPELASQFEFVTGSLIPLYIKSPIPSGLGDIYFLYHSVIKS